MIITKSHPETISFAQFVANPPDHAEWVDEQIIEKNDMTFQHSKVQTRLSRFLGNYINDRSIDGEVCVEAPCRTQKQIRRPDVAYITPELLAEFGNFNVLPQSFPLVAEVASPTDSVEDFLAKAEEYLEAETLEVWLLIPKVKYIFVLTHEQCLRFTNDSLVTTQKVLTGFSLEVAALFR